ncbi:MAG: phosphoglycerate kinase [Clostridia bacterium]
MLNKKTIKDISISNKKVLLRCDFNVPLDKETNSIITSDKRIVESLETINYLINAGAKVIIISHLGKFCKNLSLAPVAVRLSELLNKEVMFLNDCIGEDVDNAVKNMKSGDVILLENLRKYEEEELNDDEFAKKLAKGKNIFVNDAFGTAHRAHASTVGVTKYLDSVSGFLIEKEIEALDYAINNPVRPLLAIIGGSKVSSKIDVLNNLINKVDTMLIGGAMAYTFLKALGYSVGKSMVEDDKISMAKDILNFAKEKNVNVVLPIDHIVASEVSNDADVAECNNDNFISDYMGVDIGNETIKLFVNEINKAKTIVFNGPVGIFELDAFSSGTKAIIEAMANSSAITIIGGGDSASASEKFGFDKDMTHISTGGGASLEFMEGKKLPGIEALMDR